MAIPQRKASRRRAGFAAGTILALLGGLVVATAPVASASPAASAATPAVSAVAAAPKATTVKVTRSKASQTYGSKNTVVIRTTVVSADKTVPKGKVGIYVDGVVVNWQILDADGKASYTIKSTATPGKRSVQVKFVASSKTKYQASKSDKFSLVVYKLTPTLTTQFRPGTLTYGKTGQLLVKVKAPGVSAGGTVLLKRGTKSISSGRLNANGAVLLPTDAAVLPGKKRGYTAIYNGDTRIAKGRTNAYADVNKVKPTGVTIGLSRTSALTNQKVTATVSVTSPLGAVDGKVTVKVGAHRFGPVALVNGRGTIVIPTGRPVGTLSVTASYQGGSSVFQGPVGSAAASIKYSKPSVSNPCPATADACVDLTNERAWLQSGGKVVYGPVKMTAGKAGHRTNPGVHYVFWKDKDHKSSIFNNAPMPNSVFFDGGIAFHQGSVYDQSHGCIHLTWDDSEYFYNFLSVGDQVVVFGTDPY
ncbi:hypothetical protein D1871_17160 [Nakamurella silvestris]|nr:hypothetical protein D1871_17160 [Nakamurella silvestris]